MSGPVALVGGNEFRDEARALDLWLLDRSAERVVCVLPTAAAHERPDAAVATARRHFAALGADVAPIMILDRSDAGDATHVGAIRLASFLYLTGGNPMYLRDVLAGTPARQAIADASARGAVLAGSSAGAMALCEHMLVPRSPGLTDGLALVTGMLVVPHHRSGGTRATDLSRAHPDLEVVGIEEATGLVLHAASRHVLGAGSVTVYRGGSVVWTQAAPGP